jgi:hypothetical protein
MVADLANLAAALRSAASTSVSTRLLGESRELLLAAVLQEAPVRSGRLRQSLTVRSAGDAAQIVAIGYSRYVVQGTRAHRIQAARRAALWWPGAVHPVASVWHPGTRPNPFDRRAVARATPALRAMVRGEGQRLIQLIQEGSS